MMNQKYFLPLLSLLAFACTPIFSMEPAHTNLYTAVASKDYEQIEKLLSEGNSTIDAPGKDFFTPLQRAILDGETPVIQLLLAYGANPDLAYVQKKPNKGEKIGYTLSSLAEERKMHLNNIVGNEGNRLNFPLFLAINHYSVELVELLADYGANLEGSVYYALDVAKPLKNNNDTDYKQVVNIIKVLIKNGASLSAAHRMYAPIDLAVFLDDLQLVKFISKNHQPFLKRSLNHGNALFEALSQNKSNVLKITKILLNDFYLHAKEEGCDGTYPLHIACENCSSEVFKSILINAVPQPLKVVVDSLKKEVKENYYYAHQNTIKTAEEYLKYPFKENAQSLKRMCLRYIISNELSHEVIPGDLSDDLAEYRYNNFIYLPYIKFILSLENNGGKTAKDLIEESGQDNDERLKLIEFFDKAKCFADLPEELQNEITEGQKKHFLQQ